jgi:hypothetical protein
VPGDIVLVRSLGAPIVVLREAKHAILAVGFDPRQSDLPLRTAFPLFIDNIVRYFGQREAGFVASAAIGRSREIRLAEIGLDLESGARARIEDPFGRVSEVPVERGIIRVRAAVPGFYRLTEVGSGNDAPSAELAFNQASASASDLHSRLDDLQLPPTAVADASPSPAAPGEGPLWTVLLVAAIAIVTIEWATYHRRVTV